ncbi:alpha/beta hydrolase [Kordiimonas pumila]|uniref:Alpha/beta hydrolase n=1 Tax=Kordiimonas pumila TaxID=2161677 RepID=A0ABV7D7F6_9PROT|nr:alpha/beta hydrolase [Kordiimonas pumila]
MHYNFLTCIKLAGLTAVLLLSAPARADDPSFVDTLSEKAKKERAYFEQPNAYFIEKLEEPAVVIDGQTLHPKLQYEFQERTKSRKKKNIDYNKWLFETFATPEGKKWLLDAAEENWVKMAEDVGPMAKTENVTITGPYGDLRVKVYWPENPDTMKEPKPGLLYFHGGGFLMSTIESVEPQAKILAKEGDMIVISVNYNLAPDYPFPAAHFDAFTAYEWVVENAKKLGINPGQIGVAGDSAGGNLAISIADMEAKTGGHRPKAQLLYYPFTDAYYMEYPSYELFGDGFGLDKHFMKTATEMFLKRPEDKDHPWLNLVRSVDFAEQPITLVATAGFDPIRDQGRVFADKLKDAGIKVVYKHYPSLNHGFLEASHAIDDARTACFETARLMGQLLRE